MDQRAGIAQGRRRGRDGHGRLRGRLAALGLAVVAALLFAELGLRALDLPSRKAFHFLGPLRRDDSFVLDPVRFWRLAADGRYEANRLGLRGWLPSGPPTPRELRVAVVGDSCTFGSGVGFEETYGARLERLLQEALPGRCVEVIFAALPGYTTHQSRLLYEREVRALRPDVTVLYVGAFNDYQQAQGLSDAERSALRERPLRRLLRGTRLGRLVLDASDPELEPRNREPVEGKVRVPLPSFRENVAALLGDAREVGGQALVVVPPLPPSTLERFPRALEYRAALVAAAGEAGAPLVDGPALFAAHALERPPDWPASAAQWPLFVDGVHPTAYGHELLADALFESLATLRASRAARAVPPAGIPVLEGFSPTSVFATAGGEVVLRGLGLDGFDPRDERVFVGAKRLRDVRAEAGRLRLRLPPDLAPGDSAVELVTRDGLARAPAPLAVLQPPLEGLRTRREDGRLLLQGTLEGPPGWNVRLWASPGRLARPAETAAGAFWLEAEPSGRPAGVEVGPFVFDRLRLPSTAGSLDEEGRWSLRAAPYVLRGDEAELCLQALFFLDAGRRVLSAPFTVELAR